MAQQMTGSEGGPRRPATTTRRPRCKLIGSDGNVFAVIGNVSRALKEAGLLEQAAEFRDKAFHARSYDEVLALAQEYTDAH